MKVLFIIAFSAISLSNGAFAQSYDDGPDNNLENPIYGQDFRCIVTEDGELCANVIFGKQTDKSLRFDLLRFMTESTTLDLNNYSAKYLCKSYLKNYVRLKNVRPTLPFEMSKEKKEFVGWNPGNNSKVYANRTVVKCIGDL